MTESKEQIHGNKRQNGGYQALGDEGVVFLMCIEFQLYRMKKFWRFVSHQCEYT